MRVIMIGTIVALCVMMQSTPAAGEAEAVGLHAPDRYNGIPEECLMPMEFGYCRGKVKRYYFDMRRMKCSTFYWGGCAANTNNFKSMEECNKACLEDYVPNDNGYDDVNAGYNNNKLNSRGSSAQAINKNNNDNNNNTSSSITGKTSSYGSAKFKNQKVNIPKIQANESDDYEN